MKEHKELNALRHLYQQSKTKEQQQSIVFDWVLAAFAAYMAVLMLFVF